MKRIFPVATALVLGLGLAACTSETSETEVISDSEPLATVNGSVITEEQFNFHLERRTQGQPMLTTPEHRQLILDELVNLAVLANAAEERGLSNDPEVAGRLDNLRNAILAQALVEHIEAEGITEDEVRAEYEERYGGAQNLEYHARHILVGSEELARELIAQLQDGADFAELAEEHSDDPGSGMRGGDLGWFESGVMVQPFAEAVEALEPGELTTDPVESQFGWHIILLEDTREATPPAFEQVEGQLRQMLAHERLDAELESLREAADIEIHRQPE